MDAPLYSPDLERELAMLRRRAYGPDADIQSDPVAQVRLAELEGARAVRVLPVGLSESDGVASSRTEARPVPIEPSRTDATFAASAAASSPPASRNLPLPADADNPAIGGGIGPDVAPAVRRRTVRPWWRRRSALAIATVATVALVVAASAVAFAVRGPSPEKSLSATADKPTAGQLEAMGWMFGVYSINSQTVTGYGTFARISVWTADTWDDRRCVILTTVAQGGFGASCTRPGLDPTIDFQRFPGTSDPLDGAFPDLTVIRFIARSGVVDVWVQLPPEPSLRADAR